MEIGHARLPTDLSAIERLIALVEAVDGHGPIGEHKARGLSRSVPDFVGLVGQADEEIVAFVAMTVAGDDWWAMELAVAPGFRQHDNYRRLFDAALAEVDSRAGKGLRAWLFNPGLATAATAAGFVEERRLFKMERPLPLIGDVVYPEGVEIRRFRPGEDEGAWLELNNEAFAGHPENGAWGEADLVERFEQKWFDTDMLLMAWKGKRLVGFNWLKEDERGGEIYVIAVAPGFGERGLGRALMIDGMRRLHGRGAGKVFLYVDADNQPALRLYQRLGFYLDHVDRSFVRPV